MRWEVGVHLLTRCGICAGQKTVLKDDAPADAPVVTPAGTPQDQAATTVQVAQGEAADLSATGPYSGPSVCPVISADPGATKGERFTAAQFDINDCSFRNGNEDL